MSEPYQGGPSDPEKLVNICVTSSTSQFRIGTRGSALALWQARSVQQLFQGAAPEASFELKVIKPEGDRDKHSSLTTIGGRGVFTSALQYELLDGKIDLAVHSTKDLPGLAPNGIAIAAFPQREDPRDALISRHGVPLQELPQNPVIGTSSRRRAVQILAIRPDAVIRDLRGNIDTRLRKGQSDEYDAVILASAGLHRMGWESQITSLLPVDGFVPAPGQGALAIETRLAPDPAWEMVSRLDDADIRLAVAAERSFLRGVGGGCTTPIGAYAAIERANGVATMHFWGMLASNDGKRIERVYEEFSPDQADDRTFAIAQEVMRSVAPKWTGAGDQNPLAGISVLVTGSDSQAEPLVRTLKAHGALPQRMPTIVIEPVPDRAPLEHAVDRAVTGDADWLVLTSPNAVEPMIDALKGRSVEANVAVVGARTAEALERHGVPVHLTADGPGAERLITELTNTGISGARVLCLLSEKARPVLATGLRVAGASVEVVTAYRNVPVEHIGDVPRGLIRGGRVDAITFASPSAVESFRRLAGADLPALSGAAFFAIGPTTADALHGAGLPVHGEALKQDASGFIAALTGYFGRSTTAQSSE
jgi:hydroxymethylbilane synthase